MSRYDNPGIITHYRVRINWGCRPKLLYTIGIYGDGPRNDQFVMGQIDDIASIRVLRESVAGLSRGVFPRESPTTCYLGVLPGAGITVDLPPVVLVFTNGVVNNDPLVGDPPGAGACQVRGRGIDGTRYEELLRIPAPK